MPQNVAAGAPQPSHMTPCACHCAACHGNGACVILCAGLHDFFDGKADVVDLVLRHYFGACGCTARFDAAIFCVQYGPAGDVIVAGDSDGRIHFICAQTGENLLCPLNVDSLVFSVAYSPDGTTLAAGCYQKIYFLDPTAGEIKSSLNVDSQVLSVAYSPDGTTLAAGCWGIIYFLEPTTGEIKSSLKAHSGWVRAVAWSPCGQWLVSGGDDNMVNVYDAKTFEVKWPLNGHRYVPFPIVFSIFGPV